MHTYVERKCVIQLQVCILQGKDSYKYVISVRHIYVFAAYES